MFDWTTNFLSSLTPDIKAVDVFITGEVDIRIHGNYPQIMVTLSWSRGSVEQEVFLDLNKLSWLEDATRKLTRATERLMKDVKTEMDNLTRILKEGE